MKVIGGPHSSVKGREKSRRVVALLGRACGLGWRRPKRKGRGGGREGVGGLVLG
jgi:hypothetical protein